MLAKVKIALCGDGSVGKTALKNRYMGQEFTGDYLATIGADFAVKDWIYQSPELSNEQEYRFKFYIWDLAGQTHFSAVRSAYYRGSHAVILVYDVTNPKSLKNIFNWLKEIGKHLQLLSLHIFLLANKIDLRASTELAISTSDGEQLAKDMSSTFQLETPISFYETSALTGENVDVVFESLAKMVINKLY